MVVIPRGQSIRGPSTSGIAAQLDGQVEVLRPQLHAGRVGARSSASAQLLQDRGGEPVPIAKESGCFRIGFERLVVELDVSGKELSSDVVSRGGKRRDRRDSITGVALHDQQLSAHPDLDVGAEERGTESAAGVPQSDLAVRVPARGRDDMLRQTV